jgi:hypothetical protein
MPGKILILTMVADTNFFISCLNTRNGFKEVRNPFICIELHMIKTFIQISKFIFNLSVALLIFIL